MARRLLFLLPVGVFCILAVYFAIGLTKDPHELPSVLIDTPVESFQLPPVKGRANSDRAWGLETADFKGEVSLLNVFGSWCVACRIEHPFLMELKNLEIRVIIQLLLLRTLVLDQVIQLL